MKKYMTPGIEFTEFSTEDVITTSAVAGAPTVEVLTPNGTVNATGLGEQNFSIFSVQ